MQNSLTFWPSDYFVTCVSYFLDCLPWPMSCSYLTNPSEPTQHQWHWRRLHWSWCYRFLDIRQAGSQGNNRAGPRMLTGLDRTCDIRLGADWWISDSNQARYLWRIGSAPMDWALTAMDWQYGLISSSHWGMAWKLIGYQKSRLRTCVNGGTWERLAPMNCK